MNQDVNLCNFKKQKIFYYSNVNKYCNIYKNDLVIIYLDIA